MSTQKYRIPGWMQLVLFGLLSVCLSLVVSDAFVREVDIVLESVSAALFLVLSVGGGQRLLDRFPQLTARKGGK